MIQVGLLTVSQKNQLLGVEYAAGMYFNPIQDMLNRWVVSLEEIERCEIEWVKALPLIDYLPKPIDLPYL